jgi:HD-GYP domain-containing protein (c-di-GMP phosphodiesterase class II)
LTGENIPLYARIIAVADTFDAMHSHRPYRPARPAYQVVTEMTQWAGTQFDPEVFEAFLRVARSEPEFAPPLADAIGEAAAGLA